METCLRGFSFMTDGSVTDLQYIEGEELERTWRTTRRERVKQREQKIWDEFVKEQDILRTVCQDDPYQFLEQLPETCLKELMETELQKMQKEADIGEDETDDKGDLPAGEDNQHTCVVTFAEDTEKDCDMFHIFDDENEKDDDSGPEDEGLAESPCTVRESAEGNMSPYRLDQKSSKSSENVANVIESSIYCAKLKDLRIKINEEILSMICSLEAHDILSVPAEEVARMCKRSAEFASRFNRIYMYQLQRQMHDVKRNNSVTLPFAKHTQFQSQMVRIVSLHQSLLQSCQVFHKSMEQTACLRESANMLQALLQSARDVTDISRHVAPPKDLLAAQHLYTDELLISCDKVDEVVNEHAVRSQEIMANAGLKCVKTQKRTAKGRGKKKAGTAWQKSGSKTDAEARLSMYSLDTLRVTVNPKSTSSKDNQSSGTSKMRLHLGSVSSSKRSKGKGAEDQAPKSQRRSPRSRRPLMRDPHAGKARAPRVCRETEITTMVEAVETCTSSHMSREPSPHTSSRHVTTPRALARDSSSPKRLHPQTTPRRNRIQSPKTRLRSSPKVKNTLKIALSSIKSDTKETLDSVQVKITPVSEIQCAKRQEKETTRKETKVEERKEKEHMDTPRKERTEVPKKEKARVESQRNERDDKIEEIKEARAERKDVKGDHTSRSEGRCENKEDASVSGPGRLSQRSSDGVSYETKAEKDWSKMSSIAPARCEVTRLLKQLCSGDASGCRSERVVGVKNAQLVCISGGSPRQPSTPQLLRILEETIQKKVPKPLFQKAPASPRDLDRYRLLFNISEQTADKLFQYRTKFVQHMLTSPMYANGAVGKPWEMVGSLSEHIIDDLLLSCAQEMELQNVIRELYECETS